MHAHATSPTVGMHHQSVDISLPAGEHGPAGQADPNSGEEEHRQGQIQAGAELPAEAAFPRR